ncbi:type II toxin-antitoxin system Phd/YefM family antitoxin [Erwinia sp. LJJL01]|uniref:type II toxin-antitoxin system Phd/YefM family antitoxin n=1 Tax=Erwinia sp. LJJL01 TaxID=3391839 RepID=UPI00106233C1
MPNIIHTITTASITELKTNPMATVNSGEGYPVAILNRNQPAFYCIPADLYEQILECIGDKELAKLVKLRSEQNLHDIDLDSPL